MLAIEFKTCTFTNPYVLISFVVIVQAALSASGADRNNGAILIGSILLTNTSRILVHDINGKMIINQTFQHIEQLPVKSALHQTARMTVTDENAYIGGFDGIIFVLSSPTKFIESASTVNNNPSADVHVSVSNISLGIPCVPEVFTHTSNGVTTACFNNTDSILYIVNIHDPSDKSELSFTANSDLSNVLPAGDVFYFVQHGHLLRGDVPNGQTQMAVLENCHQAWLEMNEHHYIVIQCMDKSYLYVPEEWNSAAYGIKYGAWKNRNVKLRPCHGDGFASVVFSVNGTTVTIYDVRNDFTKDITLTGIPDANALTCTWNNNHLTFLYEDSSCDCWRQYQLAEQYVNATSSIIPYSEGMLPPLVTQNSPVNQEVLLFHPTYFLLPSAHQIFVDLYRNVTHPMITDDVVIYHAGIYSARGDDETVIKNVPNDDTEGASTGIHWGVYLVVVVVAIMMIMVLVLVTGFVTYRKKSRILNFCAW